MAWLWHTRPVKQCASKAVGLSGCFYRIHSAVLKDCVCVYVHDWQLCVFYLTFTLPKFEIVCLPQSTSQHFFHHPWRIRVQKRKDFVRCIHPWLYLSWDGERGVTFFIFSIYLHRRADGTDVLCYDVSLRFVVLLHMNIQIWDTLTEAVLVPFKGAFSHYTTPCKPAPSPAY